MQWRRPVGRGPSSTHGPGARCGARSSGQYRSALSPPPPTRRGWRAHLDQLTAAHLCACPIVTWIEPRAGFFAAKGHHQDVGPGDRIVVQDSDLHRPDFQITGSGATTALAFSGGAVTLAAGRTGGDFMIAHAGTDGVMTFQGYLPTPNEDKAADAAAINGIVNAVLRG